MNKQGGQVVVILLLVMVVALAVGLTVVGRTVTEISTSSKTEDSSRAFSAAEAGIERALQQQPAGGGGGYGTIPVNDLSNQSSASVAWDASLPRPNTALEQVPAINRADFAQFWLASPNDLSQSYNQGNFILYFGTAKDYSGNYNNEPGVEVDVIIKKYSGGYESKQYFYDSYSGASTQRGDKILTGSFNACAARSSSGVAVKTNNNANDSHFYCRVTVPPSGSYLDSSSDYPVMARVRLLYSDENHPVALAPNTGTSLPLQTSVYQSTGTSGSVTRTLQVYRQKSVLPFFFDFSLFSAGQLDK